MARSDDKPLPIIERRRARKLACWNGLIWAVGNGLTSTTLITYLATALDAPRLGLGMGLILAARHVVGPLRLAAPMVIGRWIDRRRFCLGTYLLSGLLLLALPFAAAPGVLPSAGESLAALVVLWSLYHLLEYLGTVALWSWLADLAKPAIRGRFLGRRERWIAVGAAAATVAAGLFAYWVNLRPTRWVFWAIS
jgi:hypothetical protein